MWIVFVLWNIPHSRNRAWSQAAFHKCLVREKKEVNTKETIMLREVAGLSLSTKFSLWLLCTKYEIKTKGERVSL